MNRQNIAGGRIALPESAVGVATDLDSRAREACRALERAFGLDGGPLQAIKGSVSIGLEIEVPWSSYFPDLWAKYGLDARRVSELDAEELGLLGAECSVLEDALLPKLRRAVECGVPRGNDRYWEFSLNPAFDVGLLARQVGLLGRAGLLPRDKAHSLHATLGGVAPCPSLYYLAMLLELEFVEPSRMGAGIEQTKRPIHSGWARKGRAGIYKKGAGDLSGGAMVGSELRMLQLPRSHEAFERLLGWIAWGAGAIASGAGGAFELWTWCEARARGELVLQGLSNANWTDEEGRQSHGQWELFVKAMPALRESLVDVASALDGQARALSSGA